MNLISAMRRQLGQMTIWYQNALITNIVLDYLKLETDNLRENVDTVNQIVESGRLISKLEGVNQVYYLDGIQLFTIYKTITTVENGMCREGLPCHMKVDYKFSIDYKEYKGRPKGEVVDLSEYADNLDKEV